ncbi:helix-turn-helix domain-containing protein [Clostridioides difficile]|uniref:helix-turn-helix domain-containing protein n=1 Tax=Clostridioides difficile TaxID=1496 RepID=UPI000B33D081|nr:helix-turn-helix domain-containing protein [Clostridioides difficile]MCD8637494.1 helix-turn-helix domain-containing protein [Clostridioides difficile]MCE4709255.1 helix-turn-helix domain-containing protein [Clostridioides difficile]MCG7734934.1 helix-turn-helix domain-containing protein [Clostridioides difficile]MCO5864651.1 helix-turn-helix domain-containing protein [Clostridioides difficile]MCW0796192.1 helix-turn-helix domain-containing protein [Clostridioides difficile]
MDLLRDARKKDWFWLENDLIDNLNLNVYEKMTYIVLARHANSESVCFPSNQTIAKKVGCSINTVRKAVNALEEKQLIKKTARKKNEKENDSNLYCIMSAKGISRDDIPIAGDDRGVYHEMTYPIAGDDRGVCHQVIGNNTNINNTNISNNTQSKKSLKNDRTDSDAQQVVNMMHNPSAPHAQQVVHEVHSKKTYNKKTYIKSNTTTQKESKTDYLDLSFLDLDIEKVKLTKEEYDKLISKFGKKYIHDKIVSLENYIVNGKGSRYKSHYRALVTWGNADTSKAVTKAKNPLSGFKEL